MFYWSFGDRITQIHPRHVITRWKPVIVMVKGTYQDRLDRYMPDWIDSPFEEDRHQVYAPKKCRTYSCTVKISAVQNSVP
jgi:hypothetical protein